MPKDSKGFISDFIFACHRRCPVCAKGKIFTKSMNVVDKCPECKAPIGTHDMGDGAVVLLLFILCFSIVPIVLILNATFSLPLWSLAVIAFIIGAVMMFVFLPMIKTYILLLEYRHRSGTDWEDNAK